MAPPAKRCGLASGKARGVVIGTDTATAIGKTNEAMVQTEEIKSPLQQKLNDLAEQLSKVIITCLAPHLVLVVSSTKVAMLNCFVTKAALFVCVVTQATGSPSYLLLYDVTGPQMSYYQVQA